VLYVAWPASVLWLLCKEDYVLAREHLAGSQPTQGQNCHFFPNLSLGHFVEALDRNLRVFGSIFYENDTAGGF
jgi:hypothetical protein